MPSLPDLLRESAAAVADLGGTAEAFADLDSAQLTSAISTIAALRRYVDHFGALAAGEVGHRSRPELGHQGFAQHAGFVSPVAMIQSVAGVGKHEAVRLVETGTLLAESEFRAGIIASGAIDPGSDAGPSSVPQWRLQLATAVSQGALSLDAMDAIRRVLSEITGVEDLVLTDAAVELIATAAGCTPEQLYRRARQIRDAIDVDGIASREKQQRDLRSVRTWVDAAGMHCGNWRLAPEEGTLVTEAFAQILSPRRGGPRFVDPASRASAEDLIGDLRTDEQISADAFVDLIRLATDADPGTLFGSRLPAVRVVVTADRLEKRTGFGHIEGRSDAVSFSTVERQICNTGVISIAFDTDGQCINVGRDQRLFTERQRVGMAIRAADVSSRGANDPRPTAKRTTSTRGSRRTAKPT